MATYDIGSWKPYPSCALSNFAAHSFVFDGVSCRSMEGLVQAFKFDESYKQVQACALTGEDAKNFGRRRNLHWQRGQTLWWKGKVYDRHGPEYQKLLDRAFDALATNANFRRALIDTGVDMLTHSIGSRDPYETVLTEAELCLRLMSLRERIHQWLI
ncbi:hypothetical protein KIKIMORA_02940 [Brevundimonas phage vB_BpoS-Kikimora]|uniref:Uncharacterized protein n=1 Tax=Brevundimonas phage vB_BpoS-Kikimora TaxID=2948601 RepID=A0A9E7MSU4_9CAUD|nr:hypothetical protein KIKIMORA_02940 [Brevundimonas phage vB_BpoS-Kikimora]